MNNKIDYLNGLRGISALVVVLFHYILAFYPALTRGNPSMVHNPIELLIQSSPLNILYAGKFAVYVFFVLSGFVLSSHYFNNRDNNKLISSIIKRYFRLEIPIFFTILLSYILMKLGLYFNQQTYPITLSTDSLNRLWNFEPSFLGMLKESLLTVFTLNKSDYVPSLWTMEIELYGSFMVFTILLFFGRYRFRFLIYLLLIYYLWNNYYVLFIFGLLLSDLVNGGKNYLLNITNRTLSYIILILGLYLGSFTFVNIENSVYKILNISALVPSYYHIGSVLVVLAVLISPDLQVTLSKKIPLFLGRISFSLYLLHLLVMGSFSCFLFLLLKDSFSYNITAIIMFIPSLVLIIWLSYLMTIYIDEPSIKLSNKIGKTIQAKIYPIKNKSHSCNE
ncbi:acyltransferase family protein [Paenibacillus oleatilyticus]|uniref:Acyltransferase family protein n=1 Tax=Paenibacillus oleatilyticus TaxID=2594886 RepID=A0ABV4V3L2_9BACL